MRVSVFWVEREVMELKATGTIYTLVLPGIEKKDQING
jgi:hypothetical protein